jgi:predicted nucleotidyltransferase
MPLDDSVLGFSNSWYRYAWEHPLEFELGDVSIRIVSAPVFIATKLEAFNNRGDGDYRASHDLEDIIAVIDGREELLQEMEQAPSEVQSFVRSEMQRLLHDPDFLDALPGHVIDPGRVPIVVERIRTY